MIAFELQRVVNICKNFGKMLITSVKINSIKLETGVIFVSGLAEQNNHM